MTAEEALAHLHRSDVTEARRHGLSDEQSNLCRDVIAERIAELEDALRPFARTYAYLMRTGQTSGEQDASFPIEIFEAAAKALPGTAIIAALSDTEGK